jgi:alkylation response protein AidB-like acyl-CoA dehydrogenase
MIDKNLDAGSFRQQIRQWLQDNCPQSVRDPLLGEELRFQGGNFPFADEGHRLWRERCVEQGLQAPGMDEQYGGGGYSPEQVVIFEEEMKRIDALPPLSGSGLTMVAPAVLKYGSEDIKQRFLPDTLKGNWCWCQGFSEPGAGSDLASLALRADSDGDDYILNGSKIWTTFAHHSDWMFALVRTDNSHKQKGITFLLLGVRTPGVEVKPIRMIGGNSIFNEVFFTDVRVPKANVVGNENEGWNVAKYLMQHERDSISDFGFTGGVELSDYAREAGLMVDGRLSNPQLRAELAENEIESFTFDCTLQRFNQLAEIGQEAGAHSSVLKYSGSRLMSNRSEMVVSLCGIEGTSWEPALNTEGRDAPSKAWLVDKAVAILGGTSEIQLNIISKAILNLPV